MARKFLRESFILAVVIVLQLSLSPCSALAAEDSSEEFSEPELNYVTPIPFIDVNKDLKPLLFGSKADYFISTYPTDARSARQVCQNLTDLTGKHFNLLMVEDKEELNELQAALVALNVSGVWLGGEKTYNHLGEIVLVWVTEAGMRSIDFGNFRNGGGNQSRFSQEASFYSSEVGEVVRIQNSPVTSVEHYPWMNVRQMDGPRCRSGKYEPEECEPVKCNITTGDCTTVTHPCVIQNDTNTACKIERLPCNAKCGNCTVIPPVCYAEPKPCTVVTEECQITERRCTVHTPACNTTRPPCKTIQPPCEASTPIPCTTRQPCIPTFRNDNCTTVTDPCTTNSKNETVCPSPRTVCEPTLRCPPPEVCQSSPIICPPPLIICEPETTICPPPTYTCTNPTIYCPEPVVHCPLPEIKCSEPQVICSSPVVTCAGNVVNCPAPQLICPEPDVTCPAPDVECTKPEPCEPPVTPFPPCTEEPPTDPSTTQKPCPGCGCIFMSKQHGFQWDIASCATTASHFICEG